MDCCGAGVGQRHQRQWWVSQGPLVAFGHGQARRRSHHYFCRLEAGELCMLLVYPKSARDTIPGHLLKAIRKEIEDDHS